jgi:Ca2+-transporting ATPase
MTPPDPLAPTDAVAGLTEAEAALRLATGGPNELPSSKPRKLLQQAWEVVRQPIILLLLGHWWCATGCSGVSRAATWCPVMW